MQINLFYLFVIMLLIICLFYLWAEGVLITSLMTVGKSSTNSNVNENQIVLNIKITKLALTRK